MTSMAELEELARQDPASEYGKAYRRAKRAEALVAQELAAAPAIERVPRELGGVAIRVEDLHLNYEVFEDRRAALRERIVNRKGSGRSVVRALRGVSFEIREGESVGVMGVNGSGKSTLLAALAGLLPATSGQILVSDEPKLLGVNAALLPGAPGRRNIRLGLLALGVRRDDVDGVAEQIIEWTELGEAIDRPLRTYSSGMRARLHFAIATAVKPRILLIDEALSVGDKNFRAKSMERMRELQASAGVLMMVNHSAAELRLSCDRGIWIDDGVVAADGPIDDVLAAYEAS
ncbi:MAG TPA: ATP-binding cassette domain-containing protein [Ilumatobacter sp.]|nr:ATP-binding cassette domain-containing protein [Ilumatobacter sp.]